MIPAARQFCVPKTISIPGALKLGAGKLQKEGPTKGGPGVRLFVIMELEGQVYIGFGGK